MPLERLAQPLTSGHFIYVRATQGALVRGDLLMLRYSLINLVNLSNRLTTRVKAFFVALDVMFYEATFLPFLALPIRA
jgi:hypothetical protein